MSRESWYDCFHIVKTLALSEHSLNLLYYFLWELRKWSAICFEYKMSFYTYYCPTGVIQWNDCFIHVLENIGMGIGMLPLHGIHSSVSSAQGGIRPLIGNMWVFGLVIVEWRYQITGVYMFLRDESQF